MGFGLFPKLSLEAALSMPPLKHGDYTWTVCIILDPSNMWERSGAFTSFILDTEFHIDNYMVMTPPPHFLESWFLLSLQRHVFQLLENHILKNILCDITSHLLEWQFIKGQEIPSLDEDVEKREPSCTVGKTVSWCSHQGKQYGGSSKN